MRATDVNTNKMAKSLVRDKILRERFSALWKRCLKPGARNGLEAAWKAISTGYAEPHRYYHDKEHLAHCLEQLDLAAGHIGQPDQVEMAIWFHDLINEPGRPDNEHASAEFFRRTAEARMAQSFIDNVVDLILVTTHRDQPADPDHQFICDIDMASFGCPWECFLEDSAAVKAEFPGSEEEFYRGKRAFLQSLLQRPRIFLTDFFNARYEQQARENIGRLIQMIDQRRGFEDTASETLSPIS